MQYRRILLIGCKSISIFIYLYILYKANEYQIQWNLFPALFPELSQNINGLLNMVGVYILAIPLTIILLSILNLKM